MDGARVVVTGGAGFLGRQVVDLLAQAGAEVVVPCRPQHGPFPGLPARQVPVDLREPAALDPLLAAGDLLVHLAAQSGGISFQETFTADVFVDNQRITRNVLESARRARVRRAFVASSAVVYRESAEPLAETAPLIAPFRDPVSAYAWSKVSDEVLASWYGEVVEVVVGRFTSLYGPGGEFDPQRSAVVHSLVRKAVEAERAGGAGIEVWGSGAAVRSFLHVADAARAVVDVLRDGASGTAYNIDSSEAVSIAELAALVRDAVDPGLELAFDATRPQGAPFRVLDTARLRALGFAAAIPLATGVKATVEAYRLHEHPVR